MRFPVLVGGLLFVSVMIIIIALSSFSFSLSLAFLEEHVTLTYIHSHIACQLSFLHCPRLAVHLLLRQVAPFFCD
jgi:hypothetical protein